MSRIFQLLSNICILIPVFFLGGCASWTTTDTKYEIVFQLVNVADAYTTSKIRHTDGVEEKNPLTRSIIGREPKGTDVALLFTTYGISHYIISRALPGKWRRFYQVGSIGYGTYLVMNNCRYGLC